MIFIVNADDFAFSVKQNTGVAICAVRYLSFCRIDHITIVFACHPAEEILYLVFADVIVFLLIFTRQAPGTVTGLRNHDQVGLVRQYLVEFPLPVPDYLIDHLLRPGIRTYGQSSRSDCRYLYQTPFAIFF